MPDISKLSGIAIDSVAKLSGVAKSSIVKVGGVSKAASASGIISTNLVQHLDAANSNSYSGSGSTWSDLTSSGVDGTLINSPTYSSTEGGGSFFLDGTSEYIQFPYDDAAPIRIGEDSAEVDVIDSNNVSGRQYGDVDTDGGLTIYAWARLSSSGHHSVWSNNTAIANVSGNNPEYKYYQGLELIYLSDGRVLCYCFDSKGRNGRQNRLNLETTASFHTSTVGASLGDWINICMVMNDDLKISGPSGGYAYDGNIYINGVKAGNGELANSTNGYGSGLGYRMKYTSSQQDKYDGGIGLRRGTFDAGYLSEIAVYNDILTDAEVLSNFNATKSRYGY